VGRFIPPDHAKGDESTVGGYALVHGRAAALEGPDGLSYSLEVLTDETGDAVRPFGAYVVFLQWRRVGEPGVAGHLESEFLAWADSAQEAMNLAGDTPLAECQRLLDALVAARDGDSGRRWYDVMRDEDGE
jgi:hypothetical protein